MRPRHLRCLLLLVLGGLPLGGCAAEVEGVTAQLGVRVPDACEAAAGVDAGAGEVGAGLGSLSELGLRATGDFVSERRPLAGLDGPVRMGGWPADARHVLVEATDAAGPVGDVVALSGQDLRRQVLMLPVGRACELSRQGATIPPGAATVTLPDGGLLAFGGYNGDAAVDRVLMRRPGSLEVELLDVRLSVPRTFASATLVGGRVVVAGGGAGGGRLRYDSYEVFDVASERFVPALRGRLAAGPRSAHAAVALDDGRVLVAGGVGTESDAPIASAELIDVEGKRSSEVPQGALTARRAPLLLRQRSGIVLLLGGEDARGVSVAEAEWFDPAGERFESTGAPLSPHPRATAVGLSGDRVAWFGCDPKAGPCGLQLMLPSFEVVDVPLARTALATAGLQGLWLEAPGGGVLGIHGQAAAGDAGDVQDVQDGQDASAARVPRSFEVVLNTGELTQGSPRAARTGQWPLGGGVTLVQDAIGSRLLRHRLASPYDDPSGALLQPGALGVDLDARTRWSVSEAGLVARAPQARFDVSDLRFDTLRASVEVEGSAELLLAPLGSPPVLVSIDAERVSVAGCGMARPAGFPVEVIRRGQEVTLQSAGEQVRCAVEALQGPLEVGVRATPGTRIAALSLRRR